MRVKLRFPTRQGLRRLATRIWRTEDGSVSVETVLVLPLVTLVLLLCFTYVDAFRHQNSLQKTVHTAADLVSRSSGTALTPAYMNGFFVFMQRMMDTDHDLQMRMSQIAWDEDANEFRVVWSYGSPAATTIRLDSVALNDVYGDLIPQISPGETLLLAEGLLRYQPPFRVGLPAQNFGTVTFVRPRYAPGIAFEDPDAPPPPMAWCEYVVDACGM